MPGQPARAGWLSAAMPVRSGGIYGRGTVGIGQGTLTPSATDDLRHAPRLARAIFLTIVCGVLAVQVIDAVSSSAPPPRLALVASASAGGLVLAWSAFNSATGAACWPGWWRLGLLLLAQAVVTYLPLLALGGGRACTAGLLAGSVLLLVPGPGAWALFAAIVASMLAMPLAHGMDAYGVAYPPVACTVIGLAVFGLARLSAVVRRMHAARAEHVQLAVINERMRFARDLHDQLGYSLSAITLKAELTRRLVGGHPEQASDELGELADIARQALADVRLVASGYRNMSLARESAAVASLLSAAGIVVRVDVSCGALDEAVDTVLATVLREAVTNMLRHSSVRACSILGSNTASAVRLRVTNDGVRRNPASCRRGGGLENLRERLAAVDGTLSARACGDGQFELLAEVSTATGTGEDCAGEASGTTGPRLLAIPRQRGRRMP
jgi:two-component system, NarL family, sensor histidine kinase DesK